MADKATLREQIARYIAKEMKLSKTPAYSLSVNEQSYGIIFLFNQWLGGMGAIHKSDRFRVGDYGEHYPIYETLRWEVK